MLGPEENSSLGNVTTKSEVEILGPEEKSSLGNVSTKSEVEKSLGLRKKAAMET